MKYICIFLLYIGLSIAASGDSCSGRCDAAFSGSYDCQCNSQCVSYGDCCADYKTECAGSCAGRCDTDLDKTKTCQCNSACTNYGDCCADYTSLCTGNGGGGSDDDELTTLANKLWSVDSNRASSKQWTLNKQNKLSNTGSHVDKCASPLVSYVDSSLFAKDTYATFIALLDNYIARTGNNEVVTPTETNEINDFISAVMKTSVMKETYQFLYSKGYVTSTQDFENQVKDMWFKGYGRSSSSDSSGFEHVFVGEQKSNSVSGFHNWIQLYLEEEHAGDLNYYGYTKQASPNLMLLQFSWDGKVKELSSIMFGASPEFEVALFTTCFITMPNSLCSFKLNGSNVSIQTWDYKGDNVIGSAYFSV